MASPEMVCWDEGKVPREAMAGNVGRGGARRRSGWLMGEDHLAAHQAMNPVFSDSEGVGEQRHVALVVASTQVDHGSLERPRRARWHASATPSSGAAERLASARSRGSPGGRWSRYSERWRMPGWSSIPAATFGTCRMIHPRPVDLWTSPADRPEPFGPCGQPVDNIRVVHRLPTLSGLSRTSSTGSTTKLQKE